MIAFFVAVRLTGGDKHFADTPVNIPPSASDGDRVALGDYSRADASKFFLDDLLDDLCSKLRI